MAKKKDYVNFLVRLERKELDWIRKMAFKNKISIAEQIRRIIQNWNEN